MLTSKLHTLLFRVEGLMNPSFLQAKETHSETENESPEHVWGEIVSWVANDENMKIVDKRTPAQRSNDNIQTLLPVLKKRSIQMYKSAGFFCVCPIRPKSAVLLFDDTNTERYNIQFDWKNPSDIQIAIRTQEEEDFDEGSGKKISDVSSMWRFKILLYSLHLNSHITIPADAIEHGDLPSNDPTNIKKMKDANRKYLLRWLDAYFGTQAELQIDSRDRYIQDMFNVSEAEFTYIQDQKWKFKFYSAEYATNDELTIENDTERKYITLTTHSQNVHPYEPDQHRTHKMKFTNIHSVGKLVHLMRSRQYWNGSYTTLNQYPGSERLDH